MKYVCLATTAFALFAFVGCGAGPADLKGKVVDGTKTVKFGEVVVFGSDGVPKSAKIERDGSFEIKAVTSGKCKVTVNSPNPKDVVSNTRDDKSGPNPEDLKNWFKISPEFADVTKSPLTIELVAGANEKNIELPPRQVK